MMVSTAEEWRWRGYSPSRSPRHLELGLHAVDHVGDLAGNELFHVLVRPVVEAVADGHDGTRSCLCAI